MSYQTEFKTSPFRAGSVLLMMLLASYAMGISMLLGVFAPFPLIVASLVFGRYVGHLASAIVMLIPVAISFTDWSHTTSDEHLLLSLQSLYFMALWFVSVVGIEGLHRNWNPKKILVVGGLVLFVLSLLGTFASFKLQQKGIDQFLTTYVQDNAKKLEELFKGKEKDFELLALLSQTDKLVKEIKEVFPCYLFVSIMFCFWVNLILGIRTKRTMGSIKAVPFHELSLINFKVYDHLVWGVVAGLALVFTGEWVAQGSFVPYGYFLLYSTGIFYFFQGFGIFTKFLNYIGMYGFMRVLLVVFTLMLARQFIALVGLINLWFDFDQKIFTKKLE